MVHGSKQIGIISFHFQSIEGSSQVIIIMRESIMIMVMMGSIMNNNGVGPRPDQGMIAAIGLHPEEVPGAAANIVVPQGTASVVARSAPLVGSPVPDGLVVVDVHPHEDLDTTMMMKTITSPHARIDQCDLIHLTSHQGQQHLHHVGPAIMDIPVAAGTTVHVAQVLCLAVSTMKVVVITLLPGQIT
jgi:hypothetical protein